MYLLKTRRQVAPLCVFLIERERERERVRERERRRRRREREYIC